MEYKREGYCPTCNKFNAPIEIPFFVQQGRYSKYKHNHIEFYHVKICKYSCDCGTKWVEENEC